MGKDSLDLATRTKLRGRIDDVEVLRAVAIGMVLIQHAAGVIITLPWATGISYGPFGFWSGVDLFFAISGFVIGRSLLPTLPPAGEHRAFLRMTLSFWVRRAWRLLPSAWLWLILAIFAAAFFNRSGEFGPTDANVRGAAAAILNFANFHFVHTFSRAPAGAVFHYWSLSLEEQFYLALPLLVFIARDRLSFALVAIAASQFFIKRLGPWADLMADLIRSDALCLGVLLAIWSRHSDYRRSEPTILSNPICRWLLPPAFILMLAFVSGPTLGFPRITVGVVALLSAAIVWIASYDRDYLFPTGRCKQALCWLGSRSYGVYLIHIPAYFATREFWFRIRPAVLAPSLNHTLLLLATSLPLLLLLAELNFRLIEDPLRRHGVRIAERMCKQGEASRTGAVQNVG